MGQDPIVIGTVSLQDTAQVRFAEYDEVVEGFATYRSDEALNVAVLPRRTWCGRAIADPVVPQNLFRTHGDAKRGPLGSRPRVDEFEVSVLSWTGVMKSGATAH